MFALSDSLINPHQGSNFLLRLERQVGGLSVFRPYIKAYVAEFSGQSITTEQWRSHLYEFFRGQKGGDDIVRGLDDINWDGVSEIGFETRGLRLMNC